MSGNLNSDGRPLTRTSDSREVFSPQENLHPTNVFLTDISENREDFCLMQCTLPPGAIVPMHSHADRETFYVISGKIDALRVDRWEELEPGDVFDVRDGMKHAWRNSSQEAASILCVTTTKLARFLQEISVSQDETLTADEQAQRFLRLVQANGYWLASPQENAAIGLTVNWNRPGN